jgi:hypothetical protein
MACSDTGLKNFPIQTSVSVTDGLNQSIEEQFMIDVQWELRGNAPSFYPNSPLIDEGSGTTQTSTVRLSGMTYTLRTLQLCKPLHTSFLSESLKSKVRGELVASFSASSGTDTVYCLLCIPLVEGLGAPVYLEALRLDKLSGEPITCDSLIPSNRKFLSYTTCLHKTRENKTVSTTARVLVFNEGLSYPADRIQQLLQKSMGARATEFGNFQVFDSILMTTSQPFLISSEIDYKNFLRYGTLPKPFSRSQSQTPGQRVDSVSSYKCVPLNPDQTVKNNSIIIDTDTGTPLSQVLAEKEQDSSIEQKGSITPGTIERMMAVVFGTLAGIFILAVLAYILSLITSEDSSVSFPWLVERFQTVLPIVFVSTIVGIIGFLIGFFTQNQ